MFGMEGISRIVDVSRLRWPASGLSRSRSPIGASGCLADVLVKHATKAITALHGSALRGCGRFALPRHALPQPLVGPGFPVMLDELFQHVLQVTAPKDQQMVQDLAPGCPHPPFGV